RPLLLPLLPPPAPPPFPSTTLFRSRRLAILPIHLGRAPQRHIVGTHRHSIGPGVTQHQQIARGGAAQRPGLEQFVVVPRKHIARSEEHTSELQSRENLVCRLLLEKK